MLANEVAQAYTCACDTPVAGYDRSKWIDSQCAADGARTALKRSRHGCIRSNASLWNLLQGRIDALLILGNYMLFRHVDADVLVDVL